jgi:hypothetical protein
MASVLKVDRIETPSGVGNISFAQPLSGDGSQLTGVPFNMPGLTAGDVLYYDGTSWARLPKGIAAEVLTMNAGATAPEWGTGGGILEPASSATGDVLYYNGTNYVRLAKASDGDLLTLASGLPAWVATSTSGIGLLDGTNTWTKGQRGEITPLVDAANIATDFNDSNHFSVTLTANRILDNPTNLSPGQSGSIFITQDVTGGQTLSYGTYWMWAGGGAPSLSTGALLVDRLDYIVMSTSSIHGVLSLEIKV